MCNLTSNILILLNVCFSYCVRSGCINDQKTHLNGTCFLCTFFLCFHFSLHIFFPQHSIWCVHSNQLVIFTICIYLLAQGRTIQIASTSHHHQQHYNEHCHAFTLTDPVEFQARDTYPGKYLSGYCQYTLLQGGCRLNTNSARHARDQHLPIKA